MSGALYTITTRASGTILTAVIYNADHQNHVNYGDALHLGGYSPDIPTMQTQTYPGDVGSESLGLSIADELARLRYILSKVKGTTYWYQYPDSPPLITNNLIVLLGTWNASTNIPVLQSSVGIESTGYIVDTTGTTNLDGISSWFVGDTAFFSAGKWHRLPASVVPGAAARKLDTNTAPLTLFATDNDVMVVNNTGGPITLTLPASPAANQRISLHDLARNANFTNNIKWGGTVDGDLNPVAIDTPAGNSEVEYVTSDGVWIRRR